MALSQIISLLLPLFGAFPSDLSAQLLFLLHKGEAERAFNLYLKHAEETKTQDFTLLSQASIRLLEQGIQSKDLETQLMCMYGAGVAGSTELFPILEKGLYSKEPKIQLIAVNYLARLNDDEADILLLSALSSPFLITRLEALFQLAKKNHPDAIEHLQALMIKVPPEIRFLFPQIVVLLEGPRASFCFRQLLNDEDPEVRTEAILAAATEGRDDFLPQIRNLAKETHFSQQEAAFLALGELKDQNSSSFLEKYLKSGRLELQLAAASSLYSLGKKEALGTIEAQARGGNLFAIAMLGQLKESASILENLLLSENREVRLNAAFSLLQMNIFSNVEEFLLDKRDLGYLRIQSPSGGLTAWKIIPSASQQTKKYPALMENTLSLKEMMLVKCLECHEEDFLVISKKILETKQMDLLPLLVELLRNRKNETYLKLLREGHQSTSEAIRNYCTLALYRLKDEGPYENELIAWIKKAKDHPLIQFKENEEVRNRDLTPDETSQFLVEVVEALTSSRNPAATLALLHAIAYGNVKNRYALAGLIIKATE